MPSTQDRLLLALYSLYRRQDTYIRSNARIIKEAGSPRILKTEARHGLKVLRTQRFAVHAITYSMDKPELRGLAHYITHEGITYLQEKGLI